MTRASLRDKTAMTDLDLRVPPELISDFLDEAQRVMASRRAKTVFGRKESTHWIHSGLSTESGWLPIIVVLKARSQPTKKGVPDVRIFLTAVRSPEGDELNEGGYGDQAPWPDGFGDHAWTSVVEALRKAATTVTTPLPFTEFCRGYLAFFGARMSGEYRAAGWRLSVPHLPADTGPASVFSEQMIACDRDVSGRGRLDILERFGSELEQLALLLTVFWCTPVYTLRSGQRWVYEGIVDGNLIPRLRQLGFTEPSSMRPQSMPPPGALPPGPRRSIDRLNPFDHTGSGEFAPPEDAPSLLELFYEASRTDPIVTERFLAAAKAYRTSKFISHATTTGSLAYLIVAAESLVEQDLPTCPTCNSKRGILRAMKDLIFEELPCLRAREGEFSRLLSDAYEIRSKHFHTGRFVGGELEPWRTSHILEPARHTLHLLTARINAVVNALLIAWLVRRVTGAPWPRASEAAPEWREPQAFSVSVQL
jgi:hypothetical protein